MSSSVIGALRANLGLDAARFESGAKRARSALAGMRAQFLAVSGAALALGTALGLAARKGADEIDKAAKAARSMGASVTGFRAAVLAAGEAGIAADALRDSMVIMNRELAKGGKAAQVALGQLGLSLDEVSALDADERLALIADRIAETGMEAGQASALLQALGVRNKEMVLAVMSGGDAFRQARSDIEAYGLGLSRVQSDNIEQANDRIARLSIIGQYLRQELALRLVPAMGEFALRMTESMREGGALRAVLDGLSSNLQRLSTYVAVAVAGFGVRYVAALVAARLATLTFAGSLVALRGAMMRTGILIAVVAAGELVFQFSKLVTAAGGFGNAMGLLGDVAVEVWNRIGVGAEGLGSLVRGVALLIQASFIQAFEWIARKFADLTQGIADGINQMFGAVGLEARLSGMGQGLADGLGAMVDEVAGRSIEASQAAEASFSSMRMPLESIAALRAAMAGAAETTDGAAEAADRFNQALAETGGGGGGGRAGGAAAAVEDFSDAAAEAARRAQEFEQPWRSAFVGFVTGAQSAKQAIGNLLAGLAQLFANQAFTQLWGGGGGLMRLFGAATVKPFATGTNFAPGGLALVGEQGPELINLPRGSQVHTAGETRGMMQQDVHVTVSVDNEGGVRAFVDKRMQQARPGLIQDAVGATYRAAREFPIR